MSEPIRGRVVSPTKLRSYIIIDTPSGQLQRNRNQLVAQDQQEPSGSQEIVKLIKELLTLILRPKWSWLALRLELRFALQIDFRGEMWHTLHDWTVLYLVYALFMWYPVLWLVSLPLQYSIKCVHVCFCQLCYWTISSFTAHLLHRGGWTWSCVTKKLPCCLVQNYYSYTYTLRKHENKDWSKF